MPKTKNLYPRLIADIGGTNARFCIETKPYKYKFTHVIESKNHSNLSEAILNYLESVNLLNVVSHAALSVPSPMIDDILFMVNSPWHGQSMQQIKKDIDMDSTIFLNDFHALALSIPHIKKNKLVKVGGFYEANPDKPIAIIGPGTGLGMATLIKNPLGGYLAIPAEGGRSSFPPVNDEEIELWRFIHKRFSHVSAERFVSGPGIQLIYEAYCNIQGVPIKTLPTPAEITNKGVSGEDWLCRLSIDTFCRMLGTVASNLAVITNAFGGVYIGGGIVPKILDYFLKSEFRSRFEDKGRYRPFLANMPIYVITDEFPAFLGASYALEIYLNHGYVP